MKKWSRHLLAASALAIGMGAAHADDSKTLYFYNWTEYVPPGLLEQFTKETGIKVIYSTYESNETMYAKLKTYKDGAYDLVVPSTYFVDKMRKEGMLQKIDKSKLTNFSNLDPQMLNKPFDPNNDYSIPYIWGATAIGVNSEAIDPKTITSWADLWKPEYKSSLLQAAQHSLTMAVLSATFATLIGSLTAVALYRYRFRGKPFVSGMLFVVMMSPDIVMAISLLVLFMLIGIQLGFWSLLFSHITFCLPFVVVTVFSRLKGFDVRMLEAAKDLGASELTILRKIILPLALPAVAAGWLLSFTLSMDDVVVSSFVTGPGYEILPLKIYSMVKVGVSPEVNALATILLVLSLVMVIASQIIARDKTQGTLK